MQNDKQELHNDKKTTEVISKLPSKSNVIYDPQYILQAWQKNTHQSSKFNIRSLYKNYTSTGYKG